MAVRSRARQTTPRVHGKETDASREMGTKVETVEGAEQHEKELEEEDSLLNHHIKHIATAKVQQRGLAEGSAKGGGHFRIHEVHILECPWSCRISKCEASWDNIYVNGGLRW